MNIIGITEAARLIGVPAHKITYAFASGQVPEPKRVLGRRAFERRDIERLARHFGVSLSGKEATNER